MFYDKQAFDSHDPEDPICIGCGVKAADHREYQNIAFAEQWEGDDEAFDEAFKAWPEDQKRAAAIHWCRTEEGTYNPYNGHFLCTPCYIRAGMPSSPRGWRAP